MGRHHRSAGLPCESDASARPGPRASLGPAAPLLLRVSAHGAPDPPGELPARLPFRRYHTELRGFSVLAAHHAERARIQQAIAREYDLDDEPISSKTAWQLAYQERTDAPSAYDLIILHNFLTNATMTEDLRAELTGLARSLTSGGLLLVLGAPGGAYPAIYAAVNELATTAGLRPLPDASRQL